MEEEGSEGMTTPLSKPGRRRGEGTYMGKTRKRTHVEKKREGKETRTTQRKGQFLKGWLLLSPSR